MRQRILLIGGWIAAAIGAGLVASAAVAVAGGQVLDQPLRPLTATEVAALPVGTFETTVEDDTTSTTGAVIYSMDPAPEMDIMVLRPPRVLRGTSIDPETSGPEVFGPTGPPIARTASVEGGHASFLVTDNGLALLWATPTPGYIAQTRSVRDGSVSVAFSSGIQVWIIEASFDGTDIVIITNREPLT